MSRFSKSIKNILQNWKQNAQKYFFSYEDGFYKLFILRNSPFLMLENIIKMPGVKHDKIHQIITTNNIFLKVDVFHFEIENELVVLFSNAFYKKNVIDHFIYDSRLEIDYYTLAIKKSEISLKNRNPLYDGTHLQNDHWILSKPKGINNICRFKDTQEQYITVFFTEQWLLRFLKQSNDSVYQFMTDFILSKLDFLILPVLEPTSKKRYELFEEVFTRTIPLDQIDKEVFKNLCQDMLIEFVLDQPNGILNIEQFKMSNEQRIKILKAENYLSTFYISNFPGIENIAQHVGISTTSLKTGFQTLYGTSMYKYYQKQKMQIAHSILKEQPNIKIKDLSSQLGYENSAKFASVFKEIFGHTPSQIAYIQ